MKTTSFFCRLHCGGEEECYRRCGGEESGTSAIGFKGTIKSADGVPGVPTVSVDILAFNVDSDDFDVRALLTFDLFDFELGESNRGGGQFAACSFFNSAVSLGSLGSVS